MKCFKLLLEHLAWIEQEFLSGIRDSRKVGSLWGMMKCVGEVRKSVNQSRLVKGLGIGLLCWGFKGVQQEISSEEVITPQIGSVAFPPGQCNQSTTPSLSQTIWPRWALTQFFYRPYSPDPASCDFVLFPKLRGCRYEIIEEMKEAVTKVIDMLTQRTSMRPSRSCWNGTTSALDAEEITSKGTRVSCVYYQWKCPYEKVWKLI